VTLSTLLVMLAGPVTAYVTASPELARAVSGKVDPLVSVGSG
jgi:ABC-type enterobactin transport system permease subunit